MSNTVFDTAEIDKWARELMETAEKRLPKESKKFLRKEGTKLKKATLNEAKSKVGKKSGNYLQSIKRGKIYKFNGALSIRAYSCAPHAHLIEDGHRIVTRGTHKEVGFQPGKHIFANARKDFAKEYAGDCEKFVDEVLEKL